MFTHGDVADGFRAAADSLKQWGGVSTQIAFALDAVADEFVKKHEHWMKTMGESQLHIAEESKVHDLYKTGDEDAPDAIKDRNGEVVLALCRKCNRGESELYQHPRCDGEGEYEARRKEVEGRKWTDTASY